MSSKIRYQPKKRVRPDCLPTNPREWNEMPAAVEQAYRRGYTQGMIEAARLIKQGVTTQELAQFGHGPLWKWRYADSMQPECPPEMEVEADDREAGLRGDNTSTPGSEELSPLAKLRQMGKKKMVCKEAKHTEQPTNRLARLRAMCDEKESRQND